MNISGIVIHGNERGQTLGYPTANIDLDSHFDSGVFAGYTLIDTIWLESAIFIHPDTFLLESHILDFKGDLYGKRIDVQILEKVRGSAKFDSTETLRKQIGRDIEQIRKILSGSTAK